MTTIGTSTERELLAQITTELRHRERFLITSHLRPDGDSIGSQLALGYALKALGKQVHVVNHDRAPDPLLAFPLVEEIEIADRVEGQFDAALVMECGDLARTGMAGLDRYFVINIDHHPGNAMFGAINWFDGTAAACGEMVYDIVETLGVPLTREIATHLYLAILTDTGSFHHSSISSRTFDICSRLVAAGVDPVAVARTVYDSNSLGRLRLFGAVLSSIELDATGRLAMIYLDHDLARKTGGSYEDTEGLINLPLTVKEIQAVLFFKQGEGNQHRVSMRSKGEIDVCSVAKEFGGGGHKNASGCTVSGRLEDVRAMLVDRVTAAIDRAEGRSEVTSHESRVTSNL